MPDYAVWKIHPVNETERSVIPFYDDASNVVETHQHGGDFKEW